MLRRLLRELSKGREMRKWERTMLLTQQVQIEAHREQVAFEERAARRALENAVVRERMRLQYDISRELKRKARVKRERADRAARHAAWRARREKEIRRRKKVTP